MTGKYNVKEDQLLNDIIKLAKNGKRRLVKVL